MRLINKYTFEGWRLQKGLWVKFYSEESNNLVVTQGLNEIQTEFWKGVAYTATLYVGLITNAGFVAIALTDTAAQINGANGWTEFTGYSEAVRQTLTMGSAVAGSLDNSSSQAVFSVTSAFSLNGGFVATSNVKAGTAGKLIGAVSNASIVPFSIGDQVRVTVSSTLSN